MTAQKFYFLILFTSIAMNTFAADQIASSYPPVVQGSLIQNGFFDGGGQTVAVDSVGNRYICGYFSGTRDFNPGPGEDSKTSHSNDAFVTRFNADGSYGWTQIFGGTGSDYATAVAVSPDGATVYAGGYFNGSSAGIGGLGTVGSSGAYDAFVIALDALSGAAIEDFGTHGVQRFGGSGNDLCYGLAVWGSVVYACGKFDSANARIGSNGALGTSGGNDAFVIALDAASGAAIDGFGTHGIQKFGGSDEDYSFGVAVSELAVYAVGWFKSSDAGIGGPGTVANLSTSGYGTTFVIALDRASGAAINSFGSGGTQIFGGTGDTWGYGIATSGSTVYATGQFIGIYVGIGGLGTYNAGVVNAYVIALDATSGAAVNSFGTGGIQQFGGSDYDFGSGVAVSGSTVYVAGSFKSTDAGIGTLGTVRSSYANDAFIIALNATSGAAVTGFGHGGIQTFGGSDEDYGFSVAVSGASVFLRGFFQSNDAGIGGNVFVGGHGNFQASGFNGFLLELNTTTGLPDLAPVIFEGAGPIAVTMDEDGAPTAFNTLTFNASDGDSNSLTWSLASAAKHGTAIVTGAADPGLSATVDYTPNPNYNGSDSFTVRVSDELGATDTVVVNVTIRPRNDPPHNTVPPSIVGTPQVGEMLSTTWGTWNDNTDLTPSHYFVFGYQWQRADDASGTNAVDIESDIIGGYILTAADSCKFISVKVTAFDNGEGLPVSQSTTVASAYVQIGNVAPTISAGGPTTFCAGGSVTLTSSAASDNQWYLNGGPIGGATDQQYVATASGDYTVVNSPVSCSSATSAATTVTVNPIPAMPTISPGGPTSFCAGGSVTLTSSVASGNQWYLNGNPIGGATNQTYIATASGDYTVVNTALGCSSASSAATTVTVNPIPATPTITPDGPTTFCAGGSVTLNSSVASGNQWYLNGNPIGGATNQTYVAAASGDYTVVDTALGCSSPSSAATTVTVNPIPATPTITPGGPTTFCAGGSVTLTSSVATGNQWFLNGNPIGGAANQTFVATASGDYTVVDTTLDCSSASSAATTVTVNPIPAAPTITPGGPTTFCAGGSVTLTSSVASGNQWFLNGNPIGGAANQIYLATVSGDYTVVDTALGCSSASSAVMTVTVNPIPAAPTVTTGGPTVFGPGGSVALTSSVSIGNQWFLNGDPIVGATSQTFVATASGNYTVVDTALGCSSASSAATTVTVGKVTITSGPTATPNPAGVGQTVTFNAVAEDSNGAALTLAWDIAGTSATGSSPTRIFTAPGTYTATITATDNFGLAASGSVQVIVVAPVAGTGNDSDGDGFSDAFEIAAGTNPLNASDSPTGGTAPTISALTQSKLLIKLNFAKADSDSISFGGTLPIADGFNPAGKTVTVDVGGAVSAIKLDDKGKSSAFKLTLKSKRGVVSAQTAKFSVKLAKGNFATSLTDEGLVNGNVRGVNASVVVRVVFNGEIYQTTQAVTYTAKAGKSGSAKVPR